MVCNIYFNNSENVCALLHDITALVCWQFNEPTNRLLLFPLVSQKCVRIAAGLTVKIVFHTL